MRVLLTFLLAVTAYADVVATPSSVTSYMRESPSHDGNAPQTIVPARVHIALDLTPSETWTVTKGGDLLTACFFGGRCFRVENTAGTEITDGNGGTGDSTIVLRWLLGEQGNLADGSYTGTITVNPATGSDVIINITLIVVAAEPYLSVTYNGGYPLAGCSNPDAVLYDYLAQCPVSDEYPPNTGFSVPAKGATYVDARFGATIKRLTVATDDCNHRYSTASPFSINKTYFMCAQANGNVDIWNVATQTIAYNDVPGVNITKAFWSPITGEDEVIYFFDGGMVKKRVLNTSTTSTVKDLTGAPWNFTAISDGGTSKPSSNGYIAFWNEPEVCALKLATADVYCATYTGLATFTGIDFVEIEFDSIQNKTYVRFMSSPESPQWFVDTGGGVLTYDGSYDEKPQSANASLDGDGSCELNEDCLGQIHATLMNDVQGRVKMFWAFGDVVGSDVFLATSELSEGAQSLRPVEEGGGLRFLQAVGADDGVSDYHHGASHTGAAVVTKYEGGAITAQTISAATAANPAVITVTGHGYSNGQVKVIGSAVGNTCINGVWTIANVTTDTFELSGSTCSGAGAYNADSGYVAAGTVPASTPPNRQTIFLAVPGTNGYVKPLAQHRSKPFTASGGDTPFQACCDSSPRAAISYDGSMILFASNMGVPERPSLYMIETGYAIPSSGGGGLAGKAKIVGKGKIF